MPTRIEDEAMTDLWDRWRKHYESLEIVTSRICYDGIADCELYVKTKPKILFVMKDANDWPGGDIRTCMREGGPKGLMWRTVSRWAAGLLEGLPDFEVVDNYSVMKTSLAKVASLNLKKTSGDSFADMSMVSAYALRDRKLLIEQFGLIRPEVVIACGTFDILAWLLELEVGPDLPQDKPVRESNLGAWIVPHCHPAARIGKEDAYNSLLATIKKEHELWDMLKQGKRESVTELSAQADVR